MNYAPKLSLLLYQSMLKFRKQIGEYQIEGFLVSKRRPEEKEEPP